MTPGRRRGPLTIAAIETVPIRVPLGRTYHGSQYRMTHRSTVITRVHTDQGIIGEAYAGDEDGALSEICQIVSDEIAPQLLGEDAMRVEHCWKLTRPATFDILRDRRLGLVACAGVDAAIWDAVGKALEVPLWLLWGGFRNSLPMISIGGYYGTDTSIEDEVTGLQEKGLAGMKFKVGGLSPAEDAERVRTAREAAGKDFLLAVDANQAWTPPQAVEFARLLADLDIAWFEEPCRWHNDARAMRDVRYQAGLPVCAGQSEYSATACVDLMIAGAIDVCNFDASWSGGPTEWRRAAAAAACYDIRMGHHEEPQVSSHLLSSIPHGTYAECFDPDRDPIWWNLIANRPELRDGILELSDAPGLGWELDEDYIRRHRVDVD
ncbi:MAG: mandelate racemase/muconate lactonizing enzyme family protein [Thermoleophilia bacterium]|nr:mandelate racemase/muconate lactonizing enzyme family protein [Thermoleophilia bacterium]